MPLHPDPHQGNYLHLEISKEPEWNPERRRRQGFSSEIPRPKSHQEHAQKIGQSLVSSIKQAEELSKKTGVDPSHLLVLKFDSINNDLTNTIEKRFDARIVEERKEKIEKQDQYHMLVHFRDKQALEKFQEEAKLYEGKLQPKILPTREREDFFDSLQTVRLLSPEDRKGIRLKKENFPTGDSYYDLDIWHPGDEEGARQILQEIRLLCSKHSGHLRESIKTESLLLAKVWGSRSLIEILLEMPNISRIDLPPQLQTAYSKMFDPLELPDLDILTPESNEPMVCVIDSGVISGHPLLRNWIVDERDFDSGENTYTDLNGHGTAVAGLVIYGDIAR
ncbi:MAG: hypothetical protein JNN15_17215, partial [Blastocatellia bacterium]|nr:hypothetical protein [Blastocatellia bacterium]